MKRTVTFILLLSLFLVCLGSTALAATVWFTGDCNVRSSPSINASSLGTVSSGTCLPYLDDSSFDYRGVRWYKVSYCGWNGWVSSKYSYVDEYDDTDDYMWVQVYSDSNVRVAPNLNASKLGSVSRGMSLDYLGTTSWDARGVAWYKVYFNGYEGWISSAYTVLFP